MQLDRLGYAGFEHRDAVVGKGARYLHLLLNLDQIEQRVGVCVAELAGMLEHIQAAGGHLPACG